MTASAARRHGAAIAIGAAVLALAAGPARADDVGRVVAVLAAEGLPADLGVAEVHLPASLAGLDVAPDRVALAWPSAPRAGRMSARVTVRVGRATRRAWVPVTIAELAPAAVAARDLAPGDVIGAADVRAELRPATGARLADPATLLGARVTAPVAAGQAIAAAAVAEAPPVPRGTEVTVKIRRPGFAVTARGTLERAARTGGLATIRLASHTLVKGTLVDAATVEIGSLP